MALIGSIFSLGIFIAIIINRAGAGKFCTVSKVVGNLSETSFRVSLDDLAPHWATWRPTVNTEFLIFGRAQPKSTESCYSLVAQLIFLCVLLQEVSYVRGRTSRSPKNTEKHRITPNPNSILPFIVILLEQNFHI